MLSFATVFVGHVQRIQGQRVRTRQVLEELW